MSKQTKITKSARGRECQIRIPGVCNGDPETTVLCHYNMADLPNKEDTRAAYGCSDCHSVVDGRAPRPAGFASKIQLWFAEGVFRTQAIMLREGLIQIN